MNAHTAVRKLLEDDDLDSAREFISSVPTVKVNYTILTKAIASAKSRIQTLLYLCQDSRFRRVKPAQVWVIREPLEELANIAVHLPADQLRQFIDIVRKVGRACKLMRIIEAESEISSQDLYAVYMDLL